LVLGVLQHLALLQEALHILLLLLWFVAGVVTIPQAAVSLEMGDQIQQVAGEVAEVVEVVLVDTGLKLGVQERAVMRDSAHQVQVGLLDR